jgi:hypothetical protein
MSEVPEVTMASWLSTAAVALLICAPAVAAEQAGYTGGMVNGAGWAKLSSGEKNVYLTGLLDLSKAQSWGDGKPSEFEKLQWACKCTTAEISGGIEAFYSRDEEYREIPVVFLVRPYLQKRTKLLNESQLAGSLAKLVQLAAALHRGAEQSK